MISCGASFGPGQAVAERLVGLEIPSVPVIESSLSLRLDLAMLARAHPLVLYVFPGCGGALEGEKRAAVMDDVQHRAFRDLRPDIEAHGFTAMGVSGQAEQQQREAGYANGLAHRLLCDPELGLARALALPTFSWDGADWYQRLALIANEGRIVKAFYPIVSAWNSAAQVLAWLVLHDRVLDGGDDVG
jgi:peroxiredoxin